MTITKLHPRLWTHGEKDFVVATCPRCTVSVAVVLPLSGVFGLKSHMVYEGSKRRQCKPERGKLHRMLAEEMRHRPDLLELLPNGKRAVANDALARWRAQQVAIVAARIVIVRAARRGLAASDLDAICGAEWLPIADVAKGLGPLDLGHLSRCAQVLDTTPSAVMRACNSVIVALTSRMKEPPPRRAHFDEVPTILDVAGAVEVEAAVRVIRR